ncbi:MAG: hypothetical protein A2Y38_19780 [Spirochaetes bacterium GWB1_59_5]|nr:MAG: hypothetical protein A2Y38_19780 [Spirochaetes bacterium GWB1_59_5]
MSTLAELESTLAELGWARSVLVGFGPVRVKHNPAMDREYLPDSRADRAKFHGQEGWVVDMSNAHGRCFKVRFPSHLGVWYEPSELEPIR